MSDKKRWLTEAVLNFTAHLHLVKKQAVMGNIRNFINDWQLETGHKNGVLYHSNVG